MNGFSTISLGAARVTTVALLGAAAACNVAVTSPDGPRDPSALRVAFTNNPSGLFAAAIDEQGTQYTFLADQTEDGQTRLSEINARTANGLVVKASLDPSSELANLRGSDGSAASIVYRKNGPTKIVLTDALGESVAIEHASGLGSSATSKPTTAPFRATGDAPLDALGQGLARYAEVASALFGPDGVEADDADGAGAFPAPLADTVLRDPSLAIARILTQLPTAAQITAAELQALLTLDDAPDALSTLEGTWVLCARSDLPALDDFGVQNRLTFGTQQVPFALTTEFDEQNVFSLSRGVTINYLARTPVTQSTEGVELTLAPVYAATSLDDQGFIVVERRFGVRALPTIESFPLASEYEINATLENGAIDANGVLTFDLRSIDLAPDNVNTDADPIRLSYVREGASCSEVGLGPVPSVDIVCPAGPVTLFSQTPVSVIIPPNLADPQVEWYVVSGDAFFVDPNSAETELLVLDRTALRIGVVVRGASETSDPLLSAGECSISIGDLVPNPDGLPYTIDQCPASLTVGTPYSFGARPVRLSDEDLADGNPLWEVVSADAQYVIESPQGVGTNMTFLSPGSVEVRFSAYDPTTDSYPIVFCRFQALESIAPPELTGPLAITLTWTASADLDLSVIDPLGEEVSFASDAGSSGGRHSGDITDGSAPEAVIWADAAPLGPYSVRVSAFDADAPVTFTLTIDQNGQTNEYACSIAAGEDTIAATIDLSGDGAEIASCGEDDGPPPAAERSVFVRLTWESADDVDLLVVDPLGEGISYADPLSTTGGRHSGDDSDGFGPESITWFAEAPIGTYTVIVDSFSSETVAYTLYVEVDGVSTTVFGSIEAVETDEAFAFQRSAAPAALP